MSRTIFFGLSLLLLLNNSLVKAQEDDRDDNVGLAFGLVIAAGMSTTIGAAFVFCDKYVTRSNMKYLGAALGFAGGIMIYIALVEILQESFADFEACECLWDADDLEEGEESGAAVLMGTLMFFLGVIIIFVLDYGVHKVYQTVAAPLDMPETAALTHELPKGPDEGEEAAVAAVNAGDIEEVAGEDPETEDGLFEKSKLKRMGVLTAIALGIHNFPEGVATFVGTLEDPAVGAGLAFAIAIHNIPEGLCVAIPIYYATGNRWTGFWWAFWSGFAEFLGAILAYAFLEEVLGPASFGIVFGVVAGMMTTIVLREMIPTALKYDPEDKYVTNSIFIGAAVMAFSIILFEL